jgi:DNA repair protein RAD16
MISMECRHSPLSHYCYWNKWVANPIKKYGYSGRGRSAMRLLRSEILEKVLLRRTKVQCADVLALPPRYPPSRLRSVKPTHTLVL